MIQYYEFNDKEKQMLFKVDGIAIVKQNITMYIDADDEEDARRVFQDTDEDQIYKREITSYATESSVIKEVQPAEEEKIKEYEDDCKDEEIDRITSNIDWDKFVDNSEDGDDYSLVHVTSEKPLKKLNALLEKYTKYKNIAAFNLDFFENRSIWIVPYKQSVKGLRSLARGYICLNDLVPFEEMLEFLKTL